MSKDFLKRLMALTYIPSFILPVLVAAFAYFNVFTPSFGLTVAMMVFAVTACFACTPSFYPSVNFDKALPERSNALPAMAICLSPVGYLVARLGHAATPETSSASLSLVFLMMLMMCVGLIVGHINAWVTSRRYRDEYRAQVRAKAEAALAESMADLTVMLPAAVAQQIKAKLESATAEEIEEIAQAIKTLKGKTPELLVQ